MRNYGSVSSLIYRNEGYRNLSEKSRWMFIYLLTCNHGNMIGCFNLPADYAVSDLQWSAEDVKVTIAELLRNDFVMIDSEKEWVLIPKYLKWNPPLNPNVGKAMVRLFESIPNNIILKREMYSQLQQYGKHIEIGIISESFRNDSIPGPVLGNGIVLEKGGVGEKTISEENPDKENSANEKKTLLSERFKKWWETYPRKEDRKKAEVSFMRLTELKRLECEDMTPGWIQAHQQAVTPKQYIPQATTYLNGERWNDDLEVIWSRRQVSELQDNGKKPVDPAMQKRLDELEEEGKRIYGR